MPNLCSPRPVTLAARLSLTVLAAHIIGVSLVAVVPVSVSAATMDDLTAAINAEYSDGAGRTTLVLHPSDYTVISWRLYDAALQTARIIEGGGVHLQPIFDWAIHNLQTRKAGLVAVGGTDDPDAVDFSALIVAVVTAQVKHDAAVEGTASGQYVTGSKAIFQEAIEAAAAVLDDTEATQAAVDQAVADLAAATAVFDAARLAKIMTTTSLTSGLNPSVFGQSVTFTATIASATGATATGSVTFTTTTGNLGGPVTLSGGVATLTTSALSVGTHAITATYGGNAQYAGSVSAPLSQTVQQPQAPVTGGGGGGGGSGGRRGSGLLFPFPFNLEDTIAPGAFGGLTQWREAVTDRQHRLMCRLQGRLQFHTSSTAFNRLSQRLQHILRLDQDMVEGALKETALCQ